MSCHFQPCAPALSLIILILDHPRYHQGQSPHRMWDSHIKRLSLESANYRWTDTYTQTGPILFTCSLMDGWNNVRTVPVVALNPLSNLQQMSSEPPNFFIHKYEYFIYLGIFSHRSGQAGTPGSTRTGVHHVDQNDRAADIHHYYCHTQSQLENRDRFRIC